MAAAGGGTGPWLLCALTVLALLLGRANCSESPSVRGVEAELGDYYEDDGDELHPSDKPPNPSRTPRVNPLRVPSQTCDCEEGAAACLGEPEDGWMVEEAVAAVCPVAAEVQEARLERYCGLLATMAERQARVHLADLPVKAACGPAQAGRQGTGGQEKRKSGPSKEEELREKELARDLSVLSALVSVRAASALTPVWRSLSGKDLFYTQENAKRLRPAPHAFDEPSLRQLPPKEPQMQYASCAVVGNAGTLLEAKLAPEIDDHDFVLRVNQGPTLSNYAIHTGEKTTARLLDRKFTQLYAGSGREWLAHDPPGTTVIAAGASISSFAGLSKFMSANHTDKTLLFASTEIIQAGSALLAAFRSAIRAGLNTTAGGHGPMQPTIGLMAIQLASQVCEKVTAYGFSLRSTTTDPGCKPSLDACNWHYFDANMHGMPARPGPAATRKLALGLEGWLLKAYHVLGVLCLRPEPPGLGACGSRLGSRYLDSNGAVVPGWPRIPTILADSELARVLSWRPPSPPVPPRQHEKLPWVATPGKGPSVTADFQKKRGRLNMRLRRRRPSSSRPAAPKRPPPKVPPPAQAMASPGGLPPEPWRGIDYWGAGGEG